MALAVTVFGERATRVAAVRRLAAGEVFDTRARFVVEAFLAEPFLAEPFLAEVALLVERAFTAVELFFVAELFFTAELLLVDGALPFRRRLLTAAAFTGSVLSSTATCVPIRALSARTMAALARGSRNTSEVINCLPLRPINSTRLPPLWFVTRIFAGNDAPWSGSTSHHAALLK
ncbi:MAG: hypothetical protein J2P59_04805 [Acidimicrobiales bacterium]|nr:hypothetical protein [Acidimicrobiales bacterium]MBO0887458.1 hypothetical protein [Acidimicrobiales bacterium]